MSKNSILSYNNFRTGSAWILLILGIGLYAIGYFWINTDNVWKEISIKLGDILVIGVILGYLSNAAQFLGIFKKDLQDIIYGKDFVSQLKDITPLWENITKQMFKNKFPSIHKDFLKVINGYLPNNEVSYYNDYEANTTIDWINKEKGEIEVTDIRSFELIADNDKDFIFPLTTWTTVKDEAQFSQQIIDLTVNGKKYEIKNSEPVKDDGQIRNTVEIKLSGSTKYEIKYTRKKRYNINDDYYIGFRAKYIVNKLRVCLDYPDGIKAMFICRGTQKDFDDIRSARERRIEKKYRGLILPRQGYVFVLQKID